MPRPVIRHVTFRVSEFAQYKRLPTLPVSRSPCATYRLRTPGQNSSAEVAQSRLRRDLVLVWFALALSVGDGAMTQAGEITEPAVAG